MRSTPFLRALGLLLLGCTISWAAPKVAVRAEGAVWPADEWFDLLVRVDPAGTPLAAEGLEIVPRAAEGAAFDRPILPPAPADGVFHKPFVVRLPVRLEGADGALELGGTARRSYRIEVKVRGRTASGAAIEASGVSLPLTPGNVTRHLKAKVSLLKEPAVAGEANAVVVEAEVVAEGYWVYGAAGREDGWPTQATLVPARGAPPRALWQGGGPASPPGKKYHFGEPFSFQVPFVPLEAGHLELRVALEWSACNERFCDPNEVIYLPLAFDVQPGSGAVDRIAATVANGPGEDDDLTHKGLLELFLLALGGGLFALAMPCTYPLIPITISFFTKQAEKREGRVAGLAVAYGAGIVLIFILVGVVFGKPIVDFATLWWVNAVFAALFLVFGLSLVGLFEIRLPGFFNDLAARASGTGGYLSVFAMGTTLVITSFTCTAPIVGLVLVLAAKGGSLWRVAYTMGVFGLTMAVPFVFLSLSPKALQKMPRSGEWMKTLKVTLGIVELGLVLKFVSNMDLALGTNLIGRELFLVLWSASFLIAGLYVLGFFALFRGGARRPLTRGRALAGLGLLAVTAYLARGADGTLLHENLEAFLPTLPTRQQAYHRGFRAVVEEDFEGGLKRAQELGAPVFLHFTGYQ